MNKRSVLLAFVLVALYVLVAQSDLGKGWGIGYQVNYPFTGFSIRYFPPVAPPVAWENIGFEFNIFPRPTPRYVNAKEEPYEVRRLELTLSARLLYPVRQDEGLHYYFSAGTALTFAFEEATPILEGTDRPAIRSSLEGAILSGMGVMEIQQHRSLDRLVGTLEYGLTWDGFGPLNFFAGGIGAHYYVSWRRWQGRENP